MEGGVATVTKAQAGISFAYSRLPLIFMAIILVLLFFFRLEGDLKKMRVERGLNEDGSKPEEVK